MCQERGKRVLAVDTDTQGNLTRSLLCDDADVPGPIEAALVGVTVDDIEQPVEILRVVHTFDPCLACAVHMVRPGEKASRKVLIRPSVG